MSVRLGLISDTHSRNLEKYWRYLDSCFAEVDVILHAGDIVMPEVLEELEAAYGPVHAVLGNNDGWELKDLPDTATLEFCGVTIGLTHGHLARGAAPKAAFEIFRNAVPRPDIVVYGHSHVPRDEQMVGLRLINPGAAYRARVPEGPSVATLELAEGAEPRLTHHYFRDIDAKLSEAPQQKTDASSSTAL